LQNPFGRSSFSALALLLAVLAPVSAAANSTPPQPLVLAAGWQLQDAAKVPQSAAQVSAPAFNTAGWYSATVPGTILTTLVDNHVYPEPSMVRTTAPKLFPKAWRAPPTGTGP